MKLNYSLVIILLLISLASATSTTLGSVERGECINIVQICDNCTFINISSILYPRNKTFAIQNVEMTSDGPQYNYTFCDTNISGKYIVNMFGDEDGDTLTDSFDFEVNPQGIESTEARTSSINISIIFLVLLGLLLFIAFLFTKNSAPVKWTFFMFSIIFLVAALNIISISLSDIVVNPNMENFFDGITAIAFYFYWFVGGLLIIMWLFTFLNTWLFKKNMKRLQKFGGPM